MAEIPCRTCDGDGYLDKWFETEDGRDYPVSIPCDACAGTGNAHGPLLDPECSDA